MRTAFHRAAVATLSIAVTVAMMVAVRPQAALSDAGVLQNAVQLVSNTQSQSGPAIIPYSVAQTKDDYILIKFLFGAGGGEGLVRYKPPAGPEQVGVYVLLGKGGGDMTQSILTAFGVPAATAAQLLSLLASCPSADVQPLLPSMPSNGSVCVEQR